MTEEEEMMEHHTKEVRAANDEFNDMLNLWHERSASPSVVTTVILGRMIIMARDLFEEEEHFVDYLNGVVHQSLEQLEQLEKDSTYVH